jgi:uncharacterized small protein (DUF1192 family)
VLQIVRTGDSHRFVNFRVLQDQAATQCGQLSARNALLEHEVKRLREELAVSKAGRTQLEKQLSEENAELVCHAPDEYA